MELLNMKEWQNDYSKISGNSKHEINKGIEQNIDTDEKKLKKF